MKRTKIVCTIGPSSADKKTLEKLVKAGMNVARLNMSHGSYAEHQKVIKLIRQVSKDLDQSISIIMDLRGPRIRVGQLSVSGIKLEKGQKVIFTGNEKACNKKIPITYDKIHQDVKKDERILIADGLMEFLIEEIKGKDIYCRVVNGGLLFSNKGVNLPDTAVSLSSLSEKDKADVEFGVKNNVDFFAMSFVRNAKEVYDLKYLIKSFENKNKIKNRQPSLIIAKIERPEAVEKIKEIVDAVDAIMIARGDLGIEMPMEDVPLIQKDIINKCLRNHKPVIVATQMLESMVANPRPTRAEVSDVANAVIDHTDAIMLSGETANGKYPVQAVETMAKIAVKTEKSQFDNLESREIYRKIIMIDDAISAIATSLAFQLGAKLILVASLSGYTGRLVSRYRPELPILVSTNSDKVRNQLNLSWGVVPFVLPQVQSIEELVDRSIGYITKKSLVKTGDKIIIIAGQPVGKSGNVNWVKVHEI